MGKKTRSILPKKIAGVKVPKAVRKGRLGELLASKKGQALVAEAVMAAGAIAGAKKLKDDPQARGAVADTGRSLKHAGREAGYDASALTATLAYALGEAARSFADALRHDPGEDHPRHVGHAQAPAFEGKKKPTPQPAAPL